jgi:aryl-alcohol dehydrogenase-like predicted oxidoreductase
MQYGYLGRAGLRVSRICLGTGAFGEFGGGPKEYGGVDRATGFAVMDAALDAGINFFDTANVYGGVGHRGATETIIGSWFAQGGSRRERVVLGTKVGRVFEQDEIDGPNKDQGLSLYKIRRHFAGSLGRLGTDHIELLQMHHADLNVGWDELWEAFEGLVRQGALDYVGSCNFAAADLAHAQAVAAERHFMGLISAQHRYNLLDRTIERDVIAEAIRLGIGITVWSPLARGLLAVDTTGEPELSKDAQRQLPAHRSQLKEFSELCRDLKANEAAVAVAWLLSRPGVSSVVIGPGSVAELEQTLPATELTLDDSTLARLEEIFPA